MQSLKSDYVNVCPLTRLLPRPINDFDPVVRRGEHVQDEVIRGYVEDDQDEECLEELEYQVVVVGEDEGPDSEDQHVVLSFTAAEVQDRVFVFTSINETKSGSIPLRMVVETRASCGFGILPASQSEELNSLGLAIVPLYRLCLLVASSARYQAQHLFLGRQGDAERFDDPGASPHSFLLTTRTARVTCLMQPQLVTKPRCLFTLAHTKARNNALQKVQTRSSTEILHLDLYTILDCQETSWAIRQISMHVILPISHAWISYEEHMDFWMPISGYTNPGLIRIERSNVGEEYEWRDAVCLKEAGGIGEDLCIEEWKVLVHTIGSIYRSAKRSLLAQAGVNIAESRQ
ncbi:uncharacterized protein EV420DRAFT_1486159 [Desarmillaria tabescens]|uniref:Uncharacterized protein n=1 Tax=Armillaria tabescens TaxID=1929756 RepID=A0AA39JC14_ARMTA|nr:uncharacterized protein EV420DRAFT_1486159 [Desarmillaria tabescens]KAK0439975.1 hypothetical protein EV420DRAFT_1486159 [Desarmillaria tabescens]